MQGVSPPGRSGHAMVMLPDGRILLFGGTGGTGAPLGDTWFLGTKAIALGTSSGAGAIRLVSFRDVGRSLPRKPDPAADWTPITPPDSPAARQGHSMVTLPDGRVLLFGGSDSQGAWFNDLHAFVADQWSQITPSNGPPPARSNHNAWVRNDKLYVQGGYRETADRKITLYSDLWLFDLQSNAWQRLADAPGYVSPNADAFVRGGKVILLDPHRYDPSGGTVHMFDMDQNRWEQRKLSGDWPHGERSGYAMALAGSNACMMGGQVWDNGANAFKDSLETWVTDLEKLTSKRLQDMPYAVNDGAAVYDPAQDRFIFWGGRQSQGKLAPNNALLFYHGAKIQF